MASFRTVIATNTGATIKDKGAEVKGLNIINRHNAAIFVKFYDSDVATFQDVPVKVFQVAASSYYPASPCAISTQGTLFSTSHGLTVRVVTSATDSDNTAAATLPIIEVEYN